MVWWCGGGVVVWCGWLVVGWAGMTAGSVAVPAQGRVSTTSTLFIKLRPRRHFSARRTGRPAPRRQPAVRAHRDKSNTDSKPQHVEMKSRIYFEGKGFGLISNDKDFYPFNKLTSVN